MQDHHNRDNKNDLRRFRIGPFTILQLMAILAVLGIALTVILQYFFLS